MQHKCLIGVHIAVYGAVAMLLTPQSFIWSLMLAAISIWISVEDFLTTEIPDEASAALLLSGAAWLFFVPNDSLPDHFAGLILWPLLTLALAQGYAFLRGWTGMGLGDVKLLAGIGLWAGFQATVWVVLTASLAGIGTLIFLALLRRQQLSEVGTSGLAFGPFLCLCGWAVILMRGYL